MRLPGAESVAFASLGLAVLCGVVLAVAAMFDFVAGSDGIAAALSPNPMPLVERGQRHKPAPLALWRVEADVRTAIADLCYVLDPRV